MIAPLSACDDQRATVAFLSDAANYGAAGKVEHVETHIGHVFLVGGHAYKLKKAVRFPYLDFSTLARRRAACEAELRLNRRTAPSLYLRVVSVNRQADGALGFAPGEPVDWLVVMRRFAADDLLVHVAARGALTDRLCRRLADRIAAFHETAEIARVTDGAARLGAVIDGNAQAMAALPAGPLAAADCRILHDRSRAVLGRLACLLDARGRTGLIRHGHGDLHLANICLWQGEPTLFDCLEFNADLATIDLLHDFAFLLMDLVERGHRRAASLIFNRYCDRRGEAEGLAALPLFLSVRAAVRAHVEALRPEGEASARAYLDAALDFLDEVPPRLIAVGGISGTGKSTLARALAPEIGAAPGARLLRTDMLRKRLAGVDPEAHLPEDAYTREAHEAVYAALLGEARATLAAGRSVIVDAVFDFPDTRARVAELAADCAVPFTGVWLDAPRELLHERVAARHDDASDAGAAVVDKQLARDIGDLAGWRRIDASGSADATLARTWAVLGEGR